MITLLYRSQLVNTGPFLFQNFKDFKNLNLLVWFYGISNIVGYLIPNYLYTYTLNIYDLVGLGWVGLGSMSYQPCQKGCPRGVWLKR